MNLQRAYFLRMSTHGLMNDADSSAHGEETAEAKAQRLANEAEMIAAARASVAAGHVVSFAAVSAWIDSLGTDDELPPPQSGH